MAKVGFIGMGNMGSAILNGTFEREPMGRRILLFTAAHREKMEAGNGGDRSASCILQQRSVRTSSKYLILAVKPQYFDEVFDEIREVFKAWTDRSIPCAGTYHQKPEGAHGRSGACGAGHAQHPGSAWARA